MPQNTRTRIEIFEIKYLHSYYCNQLSDYRKQKLDNQELNLYLNRYYNFIMKHKLQTFKKEIRRQQLNSYFVMRRQQRSNASNTKEISYRIDEEKQVRTSVPTKIEVQIQPEYSLIIQKFNQKCTDLLQFCKLKQYNEVIMLLKQIVKDIKKIIKLQQSGEDSKEIVNLFLRSNLLTVAIDCLLKATSENINRGILQEISKNALSILNYSIEMAPLLFEQSLFQNSNIIPFLRCSVSQPQLDYDHMDKMIKILTHMIVVSVNSKGKLFNLLNCKNSKFHISAIFFSISRMNLRPHLIITQNFIILMKQYLQKIEQNHLNNLKYEPNALPNTCLEKHELDIICEIVNTSINEFNINFYDEEGMEALSQILDVCRILMEYFNMSEKYKFKINYKKFLQLLIYQRTRANIKSAILIILDQLIFEDQQGEISEFLIKHGDLLNCLWTIKDQYYNYIMNIFCNLALNKDTKPYLNPYVHNIFTCLRYNKGDKLIWNFTYNWFSSQKFEILASRDKLVIQLIRDSEETDQKIREIQCMFWYHLILENQFINVPERILGFDYQIVNKIRQRAYAYQDCNL